MSQYGAYGFALREARDFRWILAHYYPGTDVAPVPAARMRVLLRRTREPKLCGATELRDAAGRRVRLSERRVYRFSAWRADGLRVHDSTRGRTRARVRAPVRVTGGSTLCLRGTAEQRRPRRLLPRRAAAASRRRRDHRRQRRLARALPLRRGRRRDAGQLGRRGAEGPGRRRALLRAAQPPPDRAVRRLRRRPLAGLPRRGRRGADRGRRRPRHPRARGPLRRRGRADVLPLDLRRAHRRHRGGLRRDARSRTWSRSRTRTTTSRPSTRGRSP